MIIKLIAWWRITEDEATELLLDVYISVNSAIFKSYIFFDIFENTILYSWKFTSLQKCILPSNVFLPVALEYRSDFLFYFPCSYNPSIIIKKLSNKKKSIIL